MVPALDASYDFDLITIGGGSGGIAASRRAASHGARVLVIEGDRLGGTCVIRGCVPKKLMVMAAAVPQWAQEARAMGWQVQTQALDLNLWVDAKNTETQRLESIYVRMLDQAQVQHRQGWATVTGPHAVSVDGQTMTARHILIATGSSPRRDLFPGLNGAMVSDDILELRERPAHLLVLGAGYIACEFASIFANLGVPVTMAFRGDAPLSGFDIDLRIRLSAALEHMGIRLLPRTPLRALQSSAAGWKLDIDGPEPLRASHVLNALGRQPRTRHLGLENAGVELETSGHVRINALQQSSCPSVWAVGDTVQGPALTPVAIAQGRAWADRLFGDSARVPDLRQVPTAVFTDPPVAFIGPTEAQAAATGPVDVYESEFRPMREAFTGGQRKTYMKLMVDALSQRVIGVQMLGPDAPEIIQSLAVAVTAGVTKAQWDQTVAMHPTAAEEFVLMREPSRRHR